jgi:MFS family permease
VSSAATRQTSRTGRLRAAFRTGPLAVRDFRLFSVGQLTSTVGDFCYAVALPWFVLSAHGGTVLLGTVLACYGVPRTVLIPVGGALVDRISARAVMLTADSVRCVLVAVLAVLAAKGLASIAFLGPVAALIGAGEGVFLPASAAIMPSLLPAEDLQAGNGLSSAAIQVGALTGPVLGGVLVTLAGGSATAFALDAATFAVSAAALALMHGRRQPAVAASDPAGAAAAGGEAGGGAPSQADAEQASVWRLLRQARELQTILLIAVLANFVIAGAFEVALPTLAHHGFGAGGYGALIASFGVGSLAGTLIAARLKSLRRPALGACAGYVLGGAALSLVPFLGGLPGAAAAAAVFGAAGYFGNVVIITLLQQWAPPNLLGRVMSLVMLAAIGAFPVSVALSGVIVKVIGPVPFFPAAGAMLALAVLLAATQRQFRDFGARAGATAAESGPHQAAEVAAR